MSDGGEAEEVRRLLERGLFYLGCGLKQDAARVLEEAAALAPDDPRVRAALARARPVPDGPGRVFEIKPRRPPPDAPTSREHGGDAHVAAFAAAFAARDWAAAAGAARAMTRARPDDPRAWGSLATAERRLADFDAALTAHDRAVALGGDDPDFAQARAKTLWEAARFEEAEAAYAALLPRLDEGGREYADARMSQGMIRMTLGSPAAGVEDYEWRWRTGDIALPDVPQPYWDGTPRPDKRILFYGEQGFGDAIQFARYVPLIAERCARVIMPCKPETKRLMRTLEGAPEICDELIDRGGFDFYVPAMSAMRLFGADLDALPRDVPYLAAADEDVARLRPRIWNRQGLRVGIAWTGSPTNANDWKRAVDPALFRLLAEVPGVALFSLQKVRADAPEALRRPPDDATDLAPMLNDFADTAAAIQCLDLVITADTSVAHLAGALGKPVWVMIPVVPDWRWMLGRDDSPWYPTMRLYRQETFGDWAGVMDRVAADLKDYPKPTLSEQEARFFAANAARDGGRFEEALGGYLSVIAELPQAESAYINASNLLDVLNRHSEAEELLSKAIDHGLETPGLLLNLCRALAAQNKTLKAIDVAQQIVQVSPDSVAGHLNLGILMARQKQHREAVHHLRNAYSIAPENPDVLDALATSLMASGDRAEGLKFHERAFDLSRGETRVATNYGKALVECGQVERASEILIGVSRPSMETPKEIQLYAQARKNLALVKLLMGQIESGAEEYEWRWRTPEVETREFSVPMWAGEDLSGKVVLFHEDQGFGDTLQFARYLPLLADRGARIVIECRKPLVRLLANQMDVSDVVVRSEKLPSFDFHLPAVSAMHAFKSSLESLPDDVPYLHPLKGDVQKWRKNLNRPGLQCGLAWAGRPNHPYDHLRSLHPDHLKVLLSVDGWAFYSLQKFGEGARAELTQTPTGVVDLAPMLNDFADTAAAIQCLDLVITADTSVAHLAGALGKPVWVMIPVVPDWRWMLGRDDSPWYPTMRLYRQETFGDWAGVMDRVAADLAGYRNPADPVEGGKPKKGLLGRLFGQRS